MSDLEEHVKSMERKLLADRIQRVSMPFTALWLKHFRKDSLQSILIL